MENSHGPSNHYHYPTRDLEGAHLRDSDAVGLVVERGRVVVHIPDLDIHLPCDHLRRGVQGSALSLSLASSHSHILDT